MTEEMILMQGFGIYVFGVFFCTVGWIIDGILDRRKEKHGKPES